MNKQNPNQMYQASGEAPPPYNPDYTNQPSYQHQSQIYQTPNVIQVANPVYYQQPIYPVYRNNSVIVNTPIVRVANPRYQYICHPAYLPNINVSRVNLLQNFPACYVVFHCLLTLILAGIQISAEFINLDRYSFYSGMTVGWYCGGLMVGCSILTMFTVCIRTVRLVGISVCFNLLLLAFNIGFAIIVPALDMSESSRCTVFDDQCRSDEDINMIINADIAKIVSGALAIKMYFIFALFMKKTLKNIRYVSTSYQYVNPNYFTQNQVEQAHAVQTENAQGNRI